MLSIEGLTSNLIDVSQLCDQGMNVSINKYECVISNKDQKVLMKGSRSKHNCYIWISQSSSKSKNIEDIIFEDGVKGVPTLMIGEIKISEVCCMFQNIVKVHIEDTYRIVSQVFHFKISTEVPI